MKTRLDEITENAKRYHKKHPEVWDLFRKFTMEIIRRGFNRYSVNAIFERIRWEADISTDPLSFKISNDYRAWYARKFMAEYPEYAGFFKIRKQTSAEDPAINKPEIDPGFFENKQEQMEMFTGYRVGKY